MKHSNYCYFSICLYSQRTFSEKPFLRRNVPPGKLIDHEKTIMPLEKCRARGAGRSLLGPVRGIGGILMADGWSAFVGVSLSGAIGLLFVLIWLAIRHRERLYQSSFVVLVGRRRSWCCRKLFILFVSIAEGSIAVAATLMYCAPVFVYLISFGLKLENRRCSSGPQ